jgi:hypothetical protein
MRAALLQMSGTGCTVQEWIDQDWISGEQAAWREIHSGIDGFEG